MKEPAEIPLTSDIEYCDEAWHLILESSKECIAEIVFKGLPLIGTLEDKEVEVETI